MLYVKPPLDSRDTVDVVPRLRDQMNFMAKALTNDSLMLSLTPEETVGAGDMLEELVGDFMEMAAGLKRALESKGDDATEGEKTRIEEVNNDIQILGDTLKDFMDDFMESFSAATERATKAGNVCFECRGQIQ